VRFCRACAACMKPDSPLYLHGLWGYPAPDEVLPSPAQGWSFLSGFAIRPLGEEPAPSARYLLDKLVESLPPQAFSAAPGAVYIGTARGEITSLLSHYDTWKVSPTEALRPFPETTAGALSTLVAERLSCTGPALTLSQTCISGIAALYQAYLYAAATKEPACFGAVEAPLHPLLIESFAHLRLYTRRKTFPFTLPFSENSVVLSEGVVLGFISPAHSPWQIERIALRISRGEGTTFTGLPEAAFSALLRSLSETPPQAVILHAPGTRKGDATELAAVEAVWGRLPALTLKPLTGHSVGASGLLSLLWAQWLLSQQVWLYNTDTLRVSPPDWPTFPAHEPEGLVRHLRLETPLRRIAILGAGFGGGVAGVILQYAPL
jgi:3-oxoacyl-(acyl-carrier-protein) synthase